MNGRGRGRQKGEGRGKGAVQQFIKRRGGRRFLHGLYGEFQSAEAIADFIYRRYGFYICGNSIRNMLRHYRIRLNPAGGDRRSAGRIRFHMTRGQRLGEEGSARRSG